MRILLVRPHIGRRETGDYIIEGRLEPASLAVLASLGPRDVDYSLVDERMEGISFAAAWDLVAITVETFTARRAYEIADTFRSLGVPVVLGGLHPSLAPEEAAPHADSVVVGDAEGVWEGLVEDLRRGRLAPRYRGATPSPPQAGRLPRSDLYRGKGYLPLAIVQHGRGCRFSCEFCACRVYFGSSWTCRPPQETAAEIAARRREGLRNFLFADDNIAMDRGAALELCRALEPLGIRWGAQAGIAVARDGELLEAAARSGCVGFIIGFESVKAGTLAAMGKGQNLARADSDQARYATELENLERAGLAVWGAFTIGHDEDDARTAAELCDFAKSRRFAFAAFNILVPYLGTPLYARLAAEGRLLYDGAWWLHPDYRLNDAAFVPARMSPAELADSCARADREFNSIPSILARCLGGKGPRSPGLRALILSYNLLMRRENRKRDRLPFGYAGATSSGTGPGRRR